MFTEREAVVFVRETDANGPLLARLARQTREAASDAREDVATRVSRPAATEPVAATWQPGKGRRP